MPKFPSQLAHRTPVKMTDKLMIYNIDTGTTEYCTGADLFTITNTALALKAPLANPAFTGAVTGITKAMVGLTNADDTADAVKSVLNADKLDGNHSTAFLAAGATAVDSDKLDGNHATAFLAAAATAVNSDKLDNLHASAFLLAGDTAVAAGSLVTTNFSIVQSGSKLLLKYGATTIASISSAGYLKTLNDIEGFVAP